MSSTSDQGVMGTSGADAARVPVPQHEQAQPDMQAQQPATNLAAGEEAGTSGPRPAAGGAEPAKPPAPTGMKEEEEDVSAAPQAQQPTCTAALLSPPFPMQTQRPTMQQAPLQQQPQFQNQTQVPINMNPNSANVNMNSVMSMNAATQRWSQQVNPTNALNANVAPPAPPPPAPVQRRRGVFGFLRSVLRLGGGGGHGGNSQAPNQVPNQQQAHSRSTRLNLRGKGGNSDDADEVGPHESTKATISRAILKKAAELPLQRRHELLSAAATDPALALVFQAGEQPVPAVKDLDAKLAALLKKIKAAKAPPAAAEAAAGGEKEKQKQTESKEGGKEGEKEGKEEEEVVEKEVDALTLELIPEFKQYGVVAEEAVRAVVSIKAASEVKQRAQVALTCVLDRSGSMSGERIALVKETVHFLIDQLTPNDYLGICSYASRVRTDLPLVRMTPEARALAHTVVEAMEADNSTALYDGLVAGVRQQMAAETELKSASAAAAAAAPCSRVVHSCFLFTDGEATDGPRDPASILSGLQALQAPTDQHVTVHTFGFGEGHSVELLQSVADAQSGVYYYIRTSDDIASGFGDALGGLLAVVAKNVRIGVRPAPGVTLTAFRSGGRVIGTAGASLAAASASASALGRSRSRAAAAMAHSTATAADTDSTATAAAAAAAPAAPPVPTATAFNDMFAEESRECLLSLRLPAAASASADPSAHATLVAVTVDLEYTDVATGRCVQRSAMVSLTRAAAPRPDGALPSELVFVTAARFETLDAIEAAEAAASDGHDVSGAQGVLDAHLGRLAAAPLANNAALSALTEQTQAARASFKPRYEFNHEGVAQVASTKQALKQQRIATSTMCTLPMYAAYDHKAKAAFRSNATTTVAANYSSKASKP